MYLRHRRHTSPTTGKSDTRGRPNLARDLARAKGAARGSRRPSGAGLRTAIGRTGDSCSTMGGGAAEDRVRRHVSGRAGIAARDKAGQGTGARRSFTQKPDHSRWAVDPGSCASRWPPRCARGRATRSSRARWPARAPSSGRGDTSGHFYFRTFCAGRFGMVRAVATRWPIWSLRAGPLSEAARPDHHNTEPPSRSCEEINSTVDEQRVKTLGGGGWRAGVNAEP